MTLKSLARDAQLSLQASAGCDLRRSHIYELLAAALGHQSWASFLADSFLADAGIGAMPEGALARAFGRARQLDYAQAEAQAIAHALVGLAAQRRLGAIRRRDIELQLLPRAPHDLRRQEATDDDAEDWSDEDGADEADPVLGRVNASSQEHLVSSALLIDSLEHAASQDAQAHHLLAALYRCAKPNPYLHEESLKGRVLTAVEQGWVDDYLRRAPRYRQYEVHLRLAAEGGVRAAALEYGTAFERPEFVALAERLQGEVDPLEMARSVKTPQAQKLWLRKAAEAGSRQALEALAAEGDAWAEDHVAAWADTYWLRRAAERALDQGDAARAWTWQHVALARGDDLTASTLAARHDGGSHADQFYDSDFGGPLYVDGDAGLALPELGHAEHEEAKAAAQRILGR